MLVTDAAHRVCFVLGAVAPSDPTYWPDLVTSSAVASHTRAFYVEVPTILSQTVSLLFVILLLIMQTVTFLKIMRIVGRQGFFLILIFQF